MHLRQQVHTTYGAYRIAQAKPHATAPAYKPPFLPGGAIPTRAGNAGKTTAVKEAFN